jgi:hypothetical protein
LFSNLEFENTDDFLKRYTVTRNESTEYRYEMFMKKGTSEKSYIDIQMVINIPKFQDILYIPGVFEVLKFAWI